jgi:hypothetical protein
MEDAEKASQRVHCWHSLRRAEEALDAAIVALRGDYAQRIAKIEARLLDMRAELEQYQL